MVAVWAVIPTKNRPAELANLLQDINPTYTVIVDNGSEPPVDFWTAREVIRHEEYPPNISRLWNLGLDAVARMAKYNTEPYDVAVLNDDLRLPPDALRQMSEALRDTGAAAATPDQHQLLAVGELAIRHTVGPVDLRTRMAGFCFMLRGELGLRADESLRWWMGDDDLEWRAAELGGVVRVGGLRVDHLSPDVSTAQDPLLSAQTGLDRLMFIAKHGQAPW